MTLNEKINKILYGTVLGTTLGIIGIFPTACNEMYTKLTTDSVKKYAIFVDNIDTSRIGGFGVKDFRIAVNGDTTAKLYMWENTPFEKGKNYSFDVRRYGLIKHLGLEGEYRLENIKEKNK